MSTFSLKNSTTFLLVGALIFLLSSCSATTRFNTSTVVPAADGSVKVKKDDNGNSRIEVSVKNLAPANRLTPSKSVYVVWMEGIDGSLKNLGRLNTSESLLRGGLRASLSTVSPIKPRRLFVTAENDAAISYPGQQVVLTTENLK